MTNEIVKKSFVFNGTQIRTAIIDGEPWFVAKDVCEVFGIVDNTTAVRDLENDELTRILCVSGGVGKSDIRWAAPRSPPVLI